MDSTIQKKRIEYVDLMKGFCIILVVYHHSVYSFGVEKIDLVLNNFRMPLYFFLAGLFFKPYSCFMEFLIRKTNRILIPYFFFSWIPFCLLSFLYTKKFTHPIFWVLSPIYTYHGVLWFLKSFFISQIIFYLFYKATKNKSILTHVIILVVMTLVNYYVCGFYEKNVLSKRFPIIEHSFFTAVMVQPYLYVAYLVNSFGILKKEWGRRQTIICLIVSIVCAFLFAQQNVSLVNSRFGDFYPFAYISALSSICVVVIICRKIKKLPFVSYLGRYSLIVLGTHYAYLTVLNNLWEFPYFVNFIILLILMPPTIWLFKTLFPYFTAQKDLIKYRPKTTTESPESAETKQSRG